MRNRTLTGAASVALGAVVVAGAGPAFAATTLTQGSALSVPAGTCSLTIVSDTEAYTAAHCGAGQWTVGSPVTADDGQTIGTVSALPGDSGVDVVKVALADDVDVVGDWSVRPTESVKPGETVYTHGSSDPLGRPNAVTHADTFDIADVCGDVYTDQVALDAGTTRFGDSGGAVYDAEQRVVGVISGLAPVVFDADGNAVSCDASTMSTIVVPTESLAAASATTQAPAAPAATPGVDAADLPSAGAPAVDEDEVTEVPDAAQAEIAAAAEAKAKATEKAEAAKAAAAEKAAAKAKAAEKAEAAKAAAGEKAAAKAAAAEKAAAAKAKAPTAAAKAPAASRPEKAAAVQTLTAAPSQGVARGTRVQATTHEGRFSSMTVTAFDADGVELASMHLSTDEPMAWINVPATVPAGGHVEVQLQDAAGEPTDATVTLGGVAIN